MREIIDATSSAFFIAISDPATAAYVDADDLPSVYVYNSSGTTVEFGTALAVDAENRTGLYAFYSDIDASGYVPGEVYHIYVEATVNGITGGNVVEEFMVVAADTVRDDQFTDARATKLDNLDATVSSRSSHTAADVWTSTTRTLSSFGTLVTDVVTAVWSAVARTLTSFGSLTTDIDAELTTEHGSGSWISIEGTGANTVTVTVTDGTTALTGVRVTIKNAAGTVLSAGPLTTDENGEIEFNLDDGSYQAIPSTTSIYSGGTTSFTVASAPLAVTCEMDAIDIPASTDPLLCMVYARLTDAEGKYATTGEGTLTVVGTPRSEPSVSGSNIVGYDSTNMASTDATGLVAIELIRGVTYNIDYAFGNSYKNIRDFVVPDAASYDIKDEL